MIGICPHCKIRLDKPPFNKRDINEVMLTLKYRDKKDKNIKIQDFNQLGYCEICNATKQDLEEQKGILNPKLLNNLNSININGRA